MSWGHAPLLGLGCGAVLQSLAKKLWANEAAGRKETAEFVWKFTAEEAVGGT